MAAPTIGPAVSRTEFHRLTVARVELLTDDSAAVTFDVPPELAERFAFAHGQRLPGREGEPFGQPGRHVEGHRG